MLEHLSISHVWLEPLYNDLKWCGFILINEKSNISYKLVWDLMSRIFIYVLVMRPGNPTGLLAEMFKLGSHVPYFYNISWSWDLEIPLASWPKYLSWDLMSCIFIYVLVMRPGDPNGLLAKASTWHVHGSREICVTRVWASVIILMHVWASGFTRGWDMTLWLFDSLLRMA